MEKSNDYWRSALCSLLGLHPEIPNSLLMRFLAATNQRLEVEREAEFFMNKKGARS